ncbi:MAG: LysO family transporter [Rikenellaceae bacterium]
MFIVLAIIAIGIVIGSLIRTPKASKLFSGMLNYIIYLLLLVMGIVVGGNEQIVGNLSTIGLRALIISSGATLGSIILALILYRYINRKKECDEG